jgi:hypothetical protein
VLAATAAVAVAYGLCLTCMLCRKDAVCRAAVELAANAAVAVEYGLCLT